MTGRRWTTVAIAGTLGLAVVGAGVAWFLKAGRRDGRGKPASAAAPSPRSPMRELAEGLRRGDPQALFAVCQKFLTPVDKPPPAPTEAEGADLVEVLEGSAPGSSSSPRRTGPTPSAASTHILDRFHVDPAPGSWSKAYPPVGDLFLAGMADPSPDVRSATLTELGREWAWLPGRSMTPAEEDALADWKDRLIPPAPAAWATASPSRGPPPSSASAPLPIDAKAAPAVHYVDDPESGGVRYKALTVFANRPNLLTVDMILKRLHDPEPGIPELAEFILKGRGLTKDQIDLGGRITSPHPEIRASVVPRLRERTDIDPEVWLLQLSHDADDTVRAKAVEALVDRDSPEVDRRLREIAGTDSSPEIRALAGKHVARSSPADTTAALPPLPGSPSLNPRAN